MRTAYEVGGMWAALLLIALWLGAMGAAAGWPAANVAPVVTLAALPLLVLTHRAAVDDGLADGAVPGFLARLVIVVAAILALARLEAALY
jgi:hypothetical protein